MIVRSQELRARGAAAPVSVSLVGAGGQGVPLAADILLEAARFGGYAAELFEVYRLERCGGTVRCQVRFTQHALHPLEAADEVDFLLAMEVQAGLAEMNTLKPSGAAVVHRTWRTADGDLDAGGNRIVRQDPRIAWVEPREELARNAHLYLLGVLSRSLPLDREAWQQSFAQHLPRRMLAEGLEIFEAGAALAEVESPAVKAAR
jgi:indolepyruvate ferredoxin oxidoreductase beta subunit